VAPSRASEKRKHERKIVKILVLGAGAMLATARKRSIAAPVLEIAATHLEAYAARRVREAAGK
jgi:fructoselysine-6-P-deglycase FrlB-like protein